MYKVKTTSVFEKNIKKLSKKYRQIKNDFLPFLDLLEKGVLIGDEIPGINKKIYKTRVPSSDQNKGKSGGFRLIYYAVLNEKEIILLTIYSKAKQTNINQNEIKKIIEKLGL